MCRLEDVSIIHAPFMKSIEFQSTQRKLQTVMVYDCPSFEELIIPGECTQLQELTLVTLSLAEWTFRPEWSLLRTVSLTNIGYFPSVTLPASYTCLEFLHIADVGLRELCVRVDLTQRGKLFEKLSIRLSERRREDETTPVRIRIRTQATNWPWLETSSNCATIWENDPAE
jgi:hypothetical protein